MRAAPASALADRLGGELRGDAAVELRRVVTDTRSPLRAGDLFVGLKGRRFDGGRFAAQAFAQGASAVIVQRDSEGIAGVEPQAGQALIVVPDALDALQALARAEREAFEGPVLAITGSNGKTTTKELLRQILEGALRASVSPMSWNSQVGVALALLDLDFDARVAVIECGVSRLGEMERLRDMVRPTHGIFVNVADAHAEGLGDRESTAREKARLFEGLESAGWVLIPRDEALACEATRALGARVETVMPLDAEAVPGLPSVLHGDAALAAQAALRLGVEPAHVAKALQQLRPMPLRLEQVTTPRGVRVINDAWTADPASVAAALQTLAATPTTGRRFAVLGGMSQLGSSSAQAHREVGQWVAKLGIDRLVGVGAASSEIVAGARDAGLDAGAAQLITEVHEAAAVLEEELRRGDVVLLKASRYLGLERIAPLLVGAVEPARAWVDLDILKDNFRAVEERAGVPVMPVIKASGYGLDATRLATALEQAGASYFCVAYTEEGITLREAGIRRPILVQNVVPGDVDNLILHGLTAEVGSLRQAETVAQAAERLRRGVRVHIKVDTGMGRAGVKPQGLKALAQQCQDSEWLQIEGLMTHFAASDEPDHDYYTHLQVRLFDEAVEELAAMGIHPPLIHASNSAAVERFPAARYTMVRSGIGLLGYSTADGQALLGTRPVLRLTTRVIEVKELQTGDFVGYGLTWQASRPSTIALVALGYGDGYARALSGKAWMQVRGERCPVVGRICMDIAMLDVTHLQSPIEPGDEVLVVGNAPGEPDLRELAVLADTIPYELLTRLTGRVRRIYLGGA